VITVIANLKGGSGKSTIAFNLALWLQMQGEEVIAYDLDPQQTLNDVARLRIEDGTEPELIVNKSSAENISEKLNSHTGHVLVDVSASNLQAMNAAIDSADRVVIPVQPSQPDVWATQRFLKMLKQACSSDMPELIAFINRADTHCSVTESDEAEQALMLLDSIKVLPVRICQRTNFRRALSEGLSIFELSGKSKSAEEFGEFATALYPELIN